MSDLVSLEDRKLRARQKISDTHKAEPMTGEVFNGMNEAKQRLQDYAFCQDFAVVTTKNREERSRDGNLAM